VRRRTIARQLEHDRAAEAETDGAEPPGIDLRQRGERGGRCPAARPELCRIVAKRCAHRARLLEVAGLSAIPERVSRHGDITEPGNHAGAFHGMLAEP